LRFALKILANSPGAMDLDRDSLTLCNPAAIDQPKKYYLPN
jgi:hypothetical protein